MLDLDPVDGLTQAMTLNDDATALEEFIRNRMRMSYLGDVRWPKRSGNMVDRQALLSN